MRDFMFGEMKSVHDETRSWHGCKLAEEAGEACQCISKRKGDDELTLELMDVIHCCENLMRQMGYRGYPDQLVAQHERHQEERGYIVDGGGML